MASELKNRLSEAVKTAMRAKDKERLGVLRMMMAEFKRIEVDERIELDDERVLAVLDKQVKQRQLRNICYSRVFTRRSKRRRD